MKKLIATLFLMACYQLNAQKNIDGLINAERSFAAYSVAHGTKDAFLKFTDSNGIVFNQGKAVNAIEVWKKRENSSSVLNWRPQFVEIASSNDFGYTSGPWELKPEAASDSVIARGQFVTVWHIDKNGGWKFLVDLGVSNTPNPSNSELNKISVQKFRSSVEVNEVLKAEQAFIDFYKWSLSVSKQKGIFIAYSKFLSLNAILNRNSNTPTTEPHQFKKYVDATPMEIQFFISGSGIAPSGDLAYVYGNTIINNKQDNYLRIWRKEKQGWKIALEVLRY